MDLVVKRFEVYLINLDPTIGGEIQKTRPCLVISPDEMNLNLSTFIVAPMTTKTHKYPTRSTCNFKGKDGQIVLDQIRTVDKIRLVKKLGSVDSDTQQLVLDLLALLFAK
ncbi:MAG: transcriptional regulator [Anaerolinea sp.]|nr:transcriptional regulator [Anaerolinea sp.]